MSRIQDKILEFTFRVDNIHFNYVGRYYLKLRIASSFTNDYSAVYIKDDINGSVFHDHKLTTSTITQHTTPRKSAWAQYSFVLPIGFCKNDNRYDVYLAVEAYEVHTKSPARLMGEAKFAIYPRTNAPRVNLNALPGDLMLETNGVLTLVRTSKADDLSMHCGRVNYWATLREIPREKSPSETETPSPPPKKVVIVDRRPSPSPRVRAPASVLKKRAPVLSPELSLPLSFHLPSSGDVTPDLMDAKNKVTVSPRKKTEPSKKGKKTPPAGLLDMTQPAHVSRPGTEQIEVIVHGARSLPSNSEGSIPHPFCIVKTKTDETNDVGSQGVSSVGDVPTHTPVWEERMMVELGKDKVLDEVLILSVADNNSKEELIQYRLPVTHLQPFHHYHLEMIMPSRDIPHGTRLYTTIVRKTSALPRDYSSPNYVGFEILLGGVQQELTSPAGPLTAVARVVPDYYMYRKSMLSDMRSMTSSQLISVTFPSPHKALFSPSHTQSGGYPQMSMPSSSGVQPLWNHSYFFSNTRDKATFFTPNAALVLEFFPTTPAVDEFAWLLYRPVAFSSILLDQHAYRQLSSAANAEGMRLDGLPLQGTHLRRADDELPTIGLVLRLIVTERPDQLSSASIIRSDLPALALLNPEEESAYFRSTMSVAEQKQRGIPSPVAQETIDMGTSTTSLQHASRRYDIERSAWEMSDLRHVKKKRKQLEPIQDGEMPPHNALESILPEYQYIFVDPDPHQKGKKQPAGPPPKRLPEGADKASLSLLEHQMHEIEKYRLAVHRMGQDIVALREEIRNLETTNSKLRIELSNQNDATRLLVDSSDLDGLTKPELASRYISIKNSLQKHLSELSSYKDRVQKLQNQLIKKNDREKEYLRVSQAHHSQNELIQKLQDKANKVRRLEETIRKQESVIEKMERVRAGKGDGSQDIMQEDYRRIRSELEDLREHNHEIVSSHDTLVTEKFKLQQQLESANCRVNSLENQLHDKARTWAQEKHDMKMSSEWDIPQQPKIFYYYKPQKVYPSIDSVRNAKSVVDMATQPLYEDLEPRRFSKSHRKPKALRALHHGPPQMDTFRH